jgi:hypothetical protein
VSPPQRQQSTISTTLSSIVTIFRSQWYNSTYTLFASMLLLYYIFKSPLNDKVPSACSDVEMSIKIFTATGHHRVAKRCLELVSEVYKLAKKTIREQQEGLSMQSNLPMENDWENLIHPFLFEDYAVNHSKLR